MNDISELAMFGEIENTPAGKMVVRVCGYKIGESDGWSYWGQGLAVIFHEFLPTNATLRNLMPEGQKPSDLHLAIDFYTGDVKIVIHSENSFIGENEPKVHASIDLAAILVK